MEENLMYIICDDNGDVLHIDGFRTGGLTFSLPAILSDEQTALEVVWDCAKFKKRPLHIQKVRCLMQPVEVA